MTQGWHNDDDLMLFDTSESVSLLEDYAISASLTGFELVGLRSWDDFILRDGAGKLYTVPTVPLLRDYLRLLAYSIDVSILQHDSRFQDRIKWHVQPLVFGGDPNSEANMIWLPVGQHTEAVRWWNSKYRELKST